MEQSYPRSFKNEAILALLLKMLILIVMFFYLYALMAVNIYQLFIPSQQNPCQVNKIHTKILKGEVESKNTCVCTYLKIVERGKQLRKSIASAIVIQVSSIHIEN